MNYTIQEMISEAEIDKRIREMGAQISKDYEGKEVCLIGILKGASFFTCELAKRISVPVTIDFMHASSYGSGTVSSGVVKIDKDVTVSIEGKNVILCEDIVDTGRTLSSLKEVLKEKGANSIKVASLLDKPERRVTELTPDYVGFAVPNEFVVGYGLDYDQRYRNLPYIGTVVFEEGKEEG
ncbi:MAG: hypoxanthine phosphoribosyltransferase [Lachnospiraceae bacterium]|nr:hypoxanthine phosphoribosyltransferase [Lachnospiraceae bacterium]